MTVAADEDAFAHPDARHHFAVMTSAEQLERALAAPWDTWAVFLHPDQGLAETHLTCRGRRAA